MIGSTSQLHETKARCVLVRMSPNVAVSIAPEAKQLCAHVDRNAVRCLDGSEYGDA